MKEHYIEDLKEIKDMMRRSSRFISLSGLSGIAAGLSALIGVLFAIQFVFEDAGFYTLDRLAITTEKIGELIAIALVTLFLAITSGAYFTSQRARRNQEKIWDQQTVRLLTNLVIPLSTGGILCLILLFKGFVGWMIPITLIFYGMALINASKYTLDEIRSLGILEVLIGLTSLLLIEWSLWFWSVGFGLLHILYGFYMHRKHQS